MSLLKFDAIVNAIMAYTSVCSPRFNEVVVEIKRKTGTRLTSDRHPNGISLAETQSYLLPL